MNPLVREVPYLLPVIEQQLDADAMSANVCLLKHRHVRDPRAQKIQTRVLVTNDLGGDHDELPVLLDRAPYRLQDDRELGDPLKPLERRNQPRMRDGQAKLEGQVYRLLFVQCRVKRFVGREYRLDP